MIVIESASDPSFHADSQSKPASTLSALERERGRGSNRICADIAYLAAVVDWFSRRVLSWRLSITMQADFCIATLEEALARFGEPEIFNTDQGSQFTSIDFTKVLLVRDIKISMDGKGAWRDNVFVERLWKSV